MNQVQINASVGQEAGEAPETRGLSAQAEFWLAVAQAFLPPMQPEVAAFVADLPDHLAQSLEAAQIEAAEDIDALRVALRGLPSAESLLVHYSALFLPPGHKVSLNTAVHLDGSLNGAAMDGIEALMERHGVARAESFRDLPDHLSALLELFALLAQKHAIEDQACLAYGFLLPAAQCIEVLLAGLASTSPYLHLIRIVRRALTPFALPEPDKLRQRAQKRAGTALGVWQSCDGCGQPHVRKKEVRIMAKALEERGLSTDHLRFCPRCRNASFGWEKRPIR